MLLLIGKATYWTITGLVTLGPIVQWLVILTRFSPWQPPPSVRDHRGKDLLKELVFVAEPGRALNRLISAEATSRSGNAWIRLRDSLVGAAWGAAWGWFGIWLSSVSNSTLQIVIVTTCATAVAWTSALDVHATHVTYVCTDGFGLISGQMSRWGTFIVPHSLTDKSHAFADVEGAIPEESQLVLYKSDGMSSSRVTLQRPVGLASDGWQRWIGAVAREYENARWSRALFHLASYERRLGDLPAETRILTAVMFDIVSVLGTKSGCGPDFVRCPDGSIIRFPTGRIGFAVDGLLFENWIPLYDVLDRLGIVWQGVRLARQGAGAAYTMTEVGQVVEDWRRDHVQVIPVASIESFHEGGENFIIRMKAGQILEFDRRQIIGFDTFRRLIQSSIWQFGLEAELRSELSKDLHEVGQVAAAAIAPRTVFGERLPRHRALVWYAAFSLGLVMEQGHDIDTVSTVVFRESCRLLGRNYYPVVTTSSVETDSAHTVLDCSQSGDNSLPHDHGPEVQTAP